LDYHIPVARPDIGQDELEKVVEAVRSGWVGSKGPFIKEFESGFSSYLRSRHGVAVCNGTAALHLALVALGVGRGNKVLVPSLTFIATANAVTYTGASPVFVDSHPDYWCVDPEAVRKSITQDTRAIILVHLYGHACDIDPILEIARSRGVYVVEDCAEALGAEYKGKRVGSLGDVSCFSLYGNKTITTGEGGMCVTNDDGVAERMRILRDHGMNPSRRYWHDIIGFNYRMTNLQAALGVAQLQKIDRLVARKREIARTYRELLGQVVGITHAPEMPWAKNLYWFYSILVNANSRNSVIAYMDEQGIETRPFFYPIHMLPPYRQDLKLSTAQDLSAKGLNLPSGPVITDQEIRTTAACLRTILVERAELER
jgi:perosamine synthetase